MAYRVKDLMIRIVGSGGQGPACGMSTGQDCIWTCPPLTLTPLWPLFICPGLSATTTTGLVAACHASGVCPKLSVTADTGTKCHTGPKCHTDAAAAAEQLATLKAHLKEALEEIERQEEVVNEQAQPQTLAEVE
jgi:hypothetical protein